MGEVNINIKKGKKELINTTGERLEITIHGNKEDKPISGISFEIQAAQKNYEHYLERAEEFRELRDRLKQIKEEKGL
jgi:hypothetical protein